MAKSESTKIEFGYFHDYESEQFAFYRIPKVLFTDEYFRNLSSDAKVLYGLMLDRMALSIRNNWVDNEGESLYHIYIGTSDGIYELRKRQRCENSCRIRY
ncbi:MAG: replication initiator protein A [Blautia faecis]